jgi:hypothetical protein
VVVARVALEADAARAVVDARPVAEARAVLAATRAAAAAEVSPWPFTAVPEEFARYVSSVAAT